VFVVTIINVLRACWCGVSREVKEGVRMSSLERRKMISRVMTVLTAICAAFAVAALFVILGYILFDGLSALRPGFLINEPKPVGEPNSGIANAIVGSGIMVGIGSLIGLPVGIRAGLYLAEFGSNKVGTILRFLIDTLIVFDPSGSSLDLYVHPMGH
jgi:ABC-type phosphate transport system permease subunit